MGGSSDWRSGVNAGWLEDSWLILISYSEVGSAVLKFLGGFNSLFKILLYIQYVWVYIYIYTHTHYFLEIYFYQKIISFSINY